MCVCVCVCVCVFVCEIQTQTLFDTMTVFLYNVTEIKVDPPQTQ